MPGEGQVLGANIGTAEQRQATENPVVIADERIVFGVATVIAGVEAKAGYLVHPDGADEILTHVSRATGCYAATALNTALQFVNVLGKLRLHSFLEPADVNVF